MLSLAHVNNVFYHNSFPCTISRGDVSVSTQAAAIEPNYLSSNGFEIMYGSEFAIADHVLGSHKIILGNKVAETLFPEGNPVGKRIIVSSKSVLFGFDVAGVLAPPPTSP